MDPIIDGLAAVIYAILTSIPVWLWWILGVWAYLNLGWRFPEYKLSLEKRWRETPIPILHLVFPGRVSSGECLDDIIATSFLGGTSESRSEPVPELEYKIWSMFLFGPALFWNVFVVTVMWFVWLLTMGRVKPIHPEIKRVVRTERQFIRKKKQDTEQETRYQEIQDAIQEKKSFTRHD